MNIVDDIATTRRLADYDGEDKMVLAVDMLEAIKAQGRPKNAIMSKIPKLDETIGGFFDGQLITISGTSGHGKTTLAQSITMSFAEENIKSAWFSYEVETEDFLEQFAPLALHHFYLPEKITGRTTRWIEERVLEAKIKYGSKAVFIDHLHFLMDFHKTNNISFDIGAICRNLKTIAKEHRLIIFLICHTTKTNPDKELDLGDARDSSFIEQESDAVLYVWRDKTTENRSIVKVAKNRKRGKIGNIIGLHYENGRYFESMEFSEEGYRETINPSAKHGRKRKPVDDEDRWNY